MGFLSGKYTRETLADPDNRFSGFDMLPFDKDHGFRVVEQMRAIAADHQASVAQVALAWLLAKQHVNSVLIGASKIHQLKDNLKAAELILDDTSVAQLDAATPLPPVYPNWQHAWQRDQAAHHALGRSTNEPCASNSR